MSDLTDQWKRDEAAVFQGWDFSYLQGRASQDDPPWSYQDRARELLGGARQVLDVDTGGGELLALFAPLPAGAQAIESYAPNVEIAQKRLSPLDVNVQQVAVGAPWPFAGGAFDLILNRQGHLNVAEIARTLRPGGTFLTQQVASDNLADLAALFPGAAASQSNTLVRVTTRLQREGLAIRHSADWIGRQQFADVGALVYFLKAIPWVVPDFSVEAHAAVLLRLHERLEAGGVLAFSIARFIIEAEKPQAQ